MNRGSMGEMPPSTRVRPAARRRWRRTPGSTGRRTAPSRGRARSPNARGCSARSTASLLRPWPLPALGALLCAQLAAPAQVDLFLGVVRDLEAAGVEHGLRAGAVRHPPVRPVARVPPLHEVQLRVARPVEDLPLLE